MDIPFFGATFRRIFALWLDMCFIFIFTMVLIAFIVIKNKKAHTIYMNDLLLEVIKDGAQKGTWAARMYSTGTAGKSEIFGLSGTRLAERAALVTVTSLIISMLKSGNI